MKKLSLLLLLFFIAGIFSACSPRPTIGVDSSGLEPFVIGGIGPLTEEYASYGNAVKNGAQLAVDEINATGGVNGFRLVLNFQDSKADTETAKAVYEKLKANDMNALLGGVFSEETAVLTELSAADGILTIIPTAGGKEVLGTGGNAFRVCTDNVKLGEAAAAFLADRCQAKRPAVLYCDDAFGNREIAHAFLAACREKDLFTTEVLLTADMTEADRIRVFSLLSKESYDGIFLAIPSEHLPSFFTSFDGKTAQVLAFETPADNTDCEGLAVLSSYFATEEAGLVRNFAEAYENLFEEVPNRYAAEAYDGVYAIAESIRRSGLSPENGGEIDLGETLIEAMTRINVRGITGTLAWTTDGESTRPTDLRIYKNGEFIPFAGEENSATS